MSEAKFKVGSPVGVKKLGQEGVVLEITSKGTYRVGCGSMTLEVAEKDLAPAKPDKYKKISKNLKKRPFAVQGEITSEKFNEALDLHGMRVEEALAKVSHFIDQAILADAPKAKILHGLGTGKLLEAVHKFLRQTSVVKHFELDPTNPGVTIAYF